MDSVADGNSQRCDILHPVKQIIEYLRKNGRRITTGIFVLLCIFGAIAMATAVVLKVEKADYRRGGIGLNREDVMIIIGACLMVLAMHFWYRLAGNVSIMELFTRENNRNRNSIPPSDLEMTVTLV
ncbi:hypothetical protein CHS0354_022151 [Potamilus streckersoni]|uniref:Uncharacterized protein n=1 Tax=Potamilus streckersoni TaxID=2493646 RepID=A0AAE0RT45_9BIVA|nr:hypothetical protein CHS0354_022151 [Potamilus streckersoni]